MEGSRKIRGERNTHGDVAPGRVVDVPGGEGEVENHELVDGGGEGRGLVFDAALDDEFVLVDGGICHRVDGDGIEGGDEGNG